MTQDDFFWSAYNQAIGIGSTYNNFIFGYGPSNKRYQQTINTQGGANAVYSIFDTGLSAIMISGFYFDDLIKYIFKYIGGDNYQFYEGFIFSECYANFPDLYFMFQKKWIIVNSEDYVLDVSDA